MAVLLCDSKKTLKLDGCLLCHVVHVPFIPLQCFLEFLCIPAVSSRNIRDLQIRVRVRDWVQVWLSNFRLITFPRTVTNSGSSLAHKEVQETRLMGHMVIWTTQTRFKSRRCSKIGRSLFSIRRKWPEFLLQCAIRILRLIWFEDVHVHISLYMYRTEMLRPFSLIEVVCKILQFGWICWISQIEHFMLVSTAQHFIVLSTETTLKHITQSAQ